MELDYPEVCVCARAEVDYPDGCVCVQGQRWINAPSSARESSSWRMPSSSIVAAAFLSFFSLAKSFCTYPARRPYRVSEHKHFERNSDPRGEQQNANS